MIDNSYWLLFYVIVLTDLISQRIGELAMRSFTFTLNISYNLFLQHYSGSASSVVVLTDTGLKLQLPAIRLRNFLTHAGITGKFRVMVNSDNRLEIIERI